MNPSPQAASGHEVLLLDGASLWRARTPDTLEELDPVGDRATVERADAIVVASGISIRRQLTGARGAAAGLVVDLPVYVPDTVLASGSAKVVVQSLSPSDRVLVDGGAPYPDAALTVRTAGSGTKALLEAAFADLESGAQSPAQRAAAKWRFLDVKRALGLQLERVRKSRTAESRRMRLMHYRSGDGSLSLAVRHLADYVAADDPPADASPTALSFPALPYRSVGAPRPEGDEECDVFLITAKATVNAGPLVGEDAVATLGQYGGTTAAIVLLLEGDAGGLAATGSAGGAQLSGFVSTVERAFGAHCEMRGLSTIFHKPDDLVPGALLAHFEVAR